MLGGGNTAFDASLQDLLRQINRPNLMKFIRRPRIIFLTTPPPIYLFVLLTRNPPRVSFWKQWRAVLPS